MSNLKNLTGPLSSNNPVIVQILGICSALAVTTQLKPALVMGLSVMAVCAFSNLVLSLLRNGIPVLNRNYINGGGIYGTGWGNMYFGGTIAVKGNDIQFTSLPVEITGYHAEDRK